MDRSRAAYTGPPPPRNYAFKKKEEYRKRDSFRPVGERPIRPFRPSMSSSSSYRPNMSGPSNYRPNQDHYSLNQQVYNSNWRPRGSFRSNRPIWRPRPDRIEKRQKAKIVLKEKSSDDSEVEYTETSAQSFSANKGDHERELGQIYDTNEETGQILEDESGQILEDESGQILEEEEDEKVDEQRKEDEDSEYDQDYIEEQIDKIDNEISRLETQLASIRAKKDDEDLKESKVEVVKNSWDDLDKSALNDEELIQKVYNDNRKIVLNIDFVYSADNSSTEKSTDNNYLSIGSETVRSLLQNDLENHKKISPIISKYIASQKRNHLIRVTSLALEYKELDFVWKRKIDRAVSKYEQRRSELPSQGARSLPSPVIQSVPSPVTPNTQGSSSRNRRAGFRSDYVKSESELASALIALGVDPAEVELDVPKNVPQDDPSRLAIEPPMILDPGEKDLLCSFKSTIGLVQDPVKSLKDFNSTLELHWHNEEKDIFKTRLLQHGKNFRKIASYLPLKSTADCIQYFYREKINLGFKQAIRRGVNAGQRGRKKNKSRLDVDHAKSSFRIWKLNSDEELPRQRQGLLQYVSWDPTEYGKEEFSFEDPDEYATPWTDEEQALALKAFEEHGKDYSAISQVLGNKSEDQIRSFYANYKRKQKKQKLEEMKQIMKEIRDPGSRNSTETSVDAYDWESDGRKRGKKRNSKRKEDDLVKKKPKTKGEMEAVSTNATGILDDSSRRTISYWSVSEKAQFISSLKVHGKKWELIANDVGTKSAVQVRNFFSNSRTKLSLDQVLAENEIIVIDEDRSKSGEALTEDLKGTMGMLLTSPSAKNLGNSGIWTGSEQQVSQKFNDTSNPLSPSRNQRTLPLPLLSAATSPRALLLNPAFNESCTLAPMRNIPPHSDKNVGLGITKLEHVLSPEKNEEPNPNLSLSSGSVGKAAIIHDNVSDSSVINSVNIEAKLDQSKLDTSRKCEDKKNVSLENDKIEVQVIKIDAEETITETDKKEVQVIKIDAESETMTETEKMEVQIMKIKTEPISNLNSVSISEAELEMDSVERKSDNNEIPSKKEIDMQMDVDSSQQIVDLAQSTDMKEQPQEGNEQLSVHENRGTQSEDTEMQPTESNGPLVDNDSNSRLVEETSDAKQIVSSMDVYPKADLE